MENKVNIHKNKKKILILLLAVVFFLVYLLWYRELGTNREIPKRAKLVGNFILRGDSHSQ